METLKPGEIDIRMAGAIWKAISSSGFRSCAFARMPQWVWPLAVDPEGRSDQAPQRRLLFQATPAEFSAVKFPDFEMVYLELGAGSRAVIKAVAWTDNRPDSCQDKPATDQLIYDFQSAYEDILPQWAWQATVQPVGLRVVGQRVLTREAFIASYAKPKVLREIARQIDGLR